MAGEPKQASAAARTASATAAVHVPPSSCTRSSRSSACAASRSPMALRPPRRPSSPQTAIQAASTSAPAVSAALRSSRKRSTASGPSSLMPRRARAPRSSGEATRDSPARHRRSSPATRESRRRPPRVARGPRAARRGGEGNGREAARSSSDRRSPDRTPRRRARRGRGRRVRPVDRRAPASGPRWSRRDLSELCAAFEHLRATLDDLGAQHYPPDHGHLLTDAEGRILYFSSHLEGMLHLDGRSFLGVALREFAVRFASQPGFPEGNAEAPVTVTFRLPEGGERFFHYRSVPLAARDGPPAGTLHTVRDVTAAVEHARE